VKRAILQIVGVALLLVGQQAAITHSVWHLRDHLPGQERQDDARPAKHSHNKGQAPQSSLCDQHSSLGTLLTGDCAAQPLALPAGESHWQFAATAVRRAADSTPTPPSRAPPVLL